LQTSAAEEEQEGPCFSGTQGLWYSQPKGMTQPEQCTECRTVTLYYS